MTCRPVRFDVAEGPNVFSAVLLEVDEKEKQVRSIERILLREGENIS